MKIQFEGTTEEVLEAITVMGASIAECADGECPMEAQMDALADKYVAEAEQESKEETESYVLLQSIMGMSHYSHTKNEVVKIAEMNALHILNVMRNEMTVKPAKTLFNSREFNSLVLNLAEAMKANILETEEKGDNAPTLSDQENLKREIEKELGKSFPAVTLFTLSHNRNK